MLPASLPDLPGLLETNLAIQVIYILSQASQVWATPWLCLLEPVQSAVAQVRPVGLAGRSKPWGGEPLS